LGKFEPLEEAEAKAYAIDDLIHGEVAEDLRQKQINAMKGFLDDATSSNTRST